MKNLVKFLSIILFCYSCNTQNTQNRFILKGYIHNADNTKLYIKRFDGENFKTIDSIITHHGNFEYRGPIYYPELYRIYLANNQTYFSIFIENSKMVVTTDIYNFRNAKILGSKNHIVYQQFVQQIDSINQLYKILIQIKRDSLHRLKSTNQTEIENLIKIGLHKQKEYIKSFITKHNSSTVALYVFYQYLLKELPITELEALYQQVDNSIKNSNYAQFIEYQLEIKKFSSIGQKVLDINLPDTTGTSISLHQLQPSMVIVHFWASWNIPSLSELEAIALFEKRNSKKQMIFYHISLDSERLKWISTIKKYSLQGIHVSDLRRWKNYAAKNFSIQKLPYYILINSKGIILYKSSSFAELQKYIFDNRLN